MKKYLKNVSLGLLIVLSLILLVIAPYLIILLIAFAMLHGIGYVFQHTSVSGAKSAGKKLGKVAIYATGLPLAKGLIKQTVSSSQSILKPVQPIYSELKHKLQKRLEISRLRAKQIETNKQKVQQFERQKDIEKQKLDIEELFSTQEQPTNESNRQNSGSTV